MYETQPDSKTAKNNQTAIVHCECWNIVDFYQHDPYSVKINNQPINFCCSRANIKILLIKLENQTR